MDLDNLYNAQQNDMNSQLQKLYAENISVISYFKEVDSYIKRILDSNSDTDTITKTTTLLENNLQPLSKLKYLIFDLEDEIPEALSKKWNKQVKYVKELMSLNEVNMFIGKIEDYEEKIDSYYKSEAKQIEKEQLEKEQLEKKQVRTELENRAKEKEEEELAIIYELDKYRNHLFSSYENLLVYMNGIVIELDELRGNKYFKLEEQLLKDIENKLIPFIQDSILVNGEKFKTCGPNYGEPNFYLKEIPDKIYNLSQYLIDIKIDMTLKDSEEAFNALEELLAHCETVYIFITNLKMKDILNNFEDIRVKTDNFLDKKLNYFSGRNNYRRWNGEENQGYYIKHSMDFQNLIFGIESVYDYFKVENN